MALATLGVVVLDCPEPRALADFYAEVLGGEVTSDDGTWVDLEVPGGRALAFQAAPDFVRRPGPRPTGRSSSTWTSRSRTSTRRRRAYWPWARGSSTRRTARAPGGSTRTRQGTRSACAPAESAPPAARQVSRRSILAVDGGRRSAAARAANSVSRSTRWTLPHVSCARSDSGQPRSTSSAMRYG